MWSQKVGVGLDPHAFLNVCQTCTEAHKRKRNELHHRMFNNLTTTKRLHFDEVPLRIKPVKNLQMNEKYRNDETIWHARMILAAQDHLSPQQGMAMMTTLSLLKALDEEEGKI